MRITIQITSLFLFLSFAGTLGSAAYKDETGNFTLIKSIPLNATFVTTDNIGQVYVVVQNELLKYSEKGELIDTYSDKSLGNIYSVDASNPLRLLLFYRDFVQIVFLDDALSVLGGSIQLEYIGYEQVTLSCTSNDNGIWIYNSIDFQLIRLDQNLNTTYSSWDISQLLGIEISPDFMLEHNDYVYMNDPETGIFIFDIFGTYYKTIPIKGLSSFQVIGDEIIYFSDGALKKYNMKIFEENSVSLPFSGIVSARIEKQKLYILKENSLELYINKK